MSSKKSSGPLYGIKVIEIAGLAPSPFCGLILADYGAEVIRVDRVGSAHSVDTLGRGKKSIAIDFKKKEGIETLLKLLDKSDVLIEPFRPGVAERLGFGPSVVCQRNPRLIYSRLTGFGQNGPYASMAGHDINYLAVTGVLSMIGRKGENPIFPINLLADFAGGGLMCALGILVALYERNKSGKGQVIDAAMMDGVGYISTFCFTNLNRIFTGERGTNSLDTGANYYETYKTKDGKYMAVGPVESHFYEILLKKLGLDPKDLPHQNDPEKWPEMKDKFASIFLTKTRDEWTAIFDGSDACVTPIIEMNEVKTHPHLKSRNFLVSTPEGDVPSPAPRLSRTPAKVNGTNPEFIGEHTVQVLKSFGFSASEIDNLLKSKVIESRPKDPKAKL